MTKRMIVKHVEALLSHKDPPRFITTAQHRAVRSAIALLKQPSIAEQLKARFPWVGTDASIDYRDVAYAVADWYEEVRKGSR